jgi:hypothetical protein
LLFFSWLGREKGAEIGKGGFDFFGGGKVVVGGTAWLGWPVGWFFSEGALGGGEEPGGCGDEFGRRGFFHGWAEVG